MERIQINKIQGMSGYKLSHMASNLVFVRPSIRREKKKTVVRFLQDKTKKAVLRALCDRYPNVWPGLKDIAAKASCSPAQARRVMRELEAEDRLIVDISTNTEHNFLQVPAKKGGQGRDCTPQYFILDQKISDIYHQQEWWKARDKADASKGSSKTGNPLIQEPEATHSRTEGHSSQNLRPLSSERLDAERPLTLSAEPTILLEPTILEPAILEPTIQPAPKTGGRDGWLAGRIAIIFSKATGHIISPTTKEEGELARAEATHGTLPVLLAAYNYPDRARGITNLAFPVTLFLRELSTAIEVARQNAKENTFQVKVKGTISKLVEEHDLEPTDELVSMLCELAERHSDLYDEDWYNFEAVEEYLLNGYADYYDAWCKQQEQPEAEEEALIETVFDVEQPEAVAAVV
jgi:hypothetical protein